MITEAQALKACILAQFLTSLNKPITTFRYYQFKKTIFIEVGYNGEITMEIDPEGEFNYV